MVRKSKEVLYNKFEQFELEENSEKKKLLKIELFNIIDSINNPDSEDYQIKGLVYYNSEEDLDHNLNLALENLLKAYELDSRNFMACLYIAHCYHDKQDYQNALKYYELVDQDQLKDFQIWRYVKLIEQIGFCHHKLGNIDKGRKKFEQVFDWFKKLPEEDRAAPTEMLECLDNNDELIIQIKQLEDYLE